MPTTKIVIIGAGSASFGPRIIADILGQERLRGSTLALVDLNREGLQLIAGLARRMNREWGSGIKVTATTDRKRALPDAQFVIIAIALQREKRWRMDWAIPDRHGVRQPLGENGGPGALAHLARNVPPILEICRDMERLCPDAWLFNFTNPVPRVCCAVNRYSAIKAVGFCHQIGAAFGNISRILGVERSQLDIKAAGLNHFTWVLDVRYQRTGEDLYPALRKKIARMEPSFQPLTRAVFEAFGVFPAPGDGHLAEYLPWCHDLRTKPWEKYHLHLYDWDRAAKGRNRMWKQIEKLAQGKDSIDPYRSGSGERAVPVAVAVLNNLNQFELALNIPNKGYITNLPDDAIVEVPGVASGYGVTGLAVGDLPEPVAALCRRQLEITELAVKAAAEGDKQAALQALLLDPMVSDIDSAKAILADFLRAHRDMLPQFS